MPMERAEENSSFARVLLPAQVRPLQSVVTAKKKDPKNATEASFASTASISNVMTGFGRAQSNVMMVIIPIRIAVPTNAKTPVAGTGSWKASLKNATTATRTIMTVVKMIAPNPSFAAMASWLAWRNAMMRI